MHRFIIDFFGPANSPPHCLPDFLHFFLPWQFCPVGVCPADFLRCQLPAVLIQLCLLPEPRALAAPNVGRAVANLAPADRLDVGVLLVGVRLVAVPAELLALDEGRPDVGNLVTLVVSRASSG